MYLSVCDVSKLGDVDMCVNVCTGVCVFIRDGVQVCPGKESCRCKNM